MEPRAAVALIVGPQPAILLIRRPLRADDPWSGQWALPGGRRQDSDPDLLTTARRELAEEVGLHAIAEAWLALDIELAGRHRGLAVPVAPFVHHLDRIPDLIPDPREVAAIHWLPLASLDDQSRHRHGRVPGGGDIAWPHLILDDMPVWGFTYRVLTTWRQRPT